jgi:hypothetical protein
MRQEDGVLFNAVLRVKEKNYHMLMTAKSCALTSPHGEFIYRGPGPIASDVGTARIEGNTMGTQFQKKFCGLKSCGAVFRNPEGKHESKDEYLFCRIAVQISRGPG